MLRGVAEGPSAAAVADQLRGQGIAAIGIEPPGVSTADVPLSLGGIFKETVSHIDILLFSRQLYTLLKAGVPIMRGLSGLQESTSSKAMKEVLQEVRASLESGRELSVSLARQPKVFTPFYLSMVRVGEYTGRLEEVFFSLFQHLEFEKYMRDQVKSALRYPSFVVAAMVAAIVIVNIWVIPAVAQGFQGFGSTLSAVVNLVLLNRRVAQS